MDGPNPEEECQERALTEEERMEREMEVGSILDQDFDGQDGDVGGDHADVGAGASPDADVDDPYSVICGSCGESGPDPVYPDEPLRMVRKGQLGAKKVCTRCMFIKRKKLPHDHGQKSLTNFLMWRKQNRADLKHQLKTLDNKAREKIASGAAGKLSTKDYDSLGPRTVDEVETDKFVAEKGHLVWIPLAKWSEKEENKGKNVPGWKPDPATGERLRYEDGVLGVAFPEYDDGRKLLKQVQELLRPIRRSLLHLLLLLSRSSLDMACVLLNLLDLRWGWREYLCMDWKSNLS